MQRYKIILKRQNKIKNYFSVSVTLFSFAKTIFTLTRNIQYYNALSVNIIFLYINITVTSMQRKHQ